jgi:ribonucleoside-diphosphate reductase alpha chain
MEFSLPTPIIAKLRSKDKQFSSCVVVDIDDSLDSIFSSTHAIGRYIANSAGIGYQMGRNRGLDAPIRNGSAVHTGTFPFLRTLQFTVKSCSQGGIRGGAATCNLPVWHYEHEDHIVLKNNEGTEFNRLRQQDYCFHWNNYLIRRGIKGENISLFSPHDVPGLFEAFYEKTEDHFIELYEAAEKANVRRRVVNGKEMLLTFLNERAKTGRDYSFNTTNVNTHTTYLSPIYLTNLCTETAILTETFESIDDDVKGGIGLCTLGAVNLGKVKHPDDVRRPMHILVRALNEILDYQDYPVKHAERFTKKYYPLGIGITNFAYFLAKRGIKFSSENTEDFRATHETIESMAYYALEASIEMAKEKGRCEGFDNLIYSKGQTIVDNYMKTIDEFAPFELRHDWKKIAQDAMTYGVRNGSLLAGMPGETSAFMTNSTNGGEPIRELVSVKGNKDSGLFKQVAPEITKLKNMYELSFEMPSMTGYLKQMAVVQKFFDQAISINTYYDPARYPKNKVPMKVILQDYLNHAKWGGKTMYYHNTKDGVGIEVKEDEKPAPVEDPNDCGDACKI